MGDQETGKQIIEAKEVGINKLVTFISYLAPVIVPLISYYGLDENLMTSLKYGAYAVPAMGGIIGLVKFTETFTVDSKKTLLLYYTVIALIVIASEKDPTMQRVKSMGAISIPILALMVKEKISSFIKNDD